MVAAVSEYTIIGRPPLAAINAVVYLVTKLGLR